MSLNNARMVTDRSAVSNDATKTCAVWESWSESWEIDRLVICDCDIDTIWSRTSLSNPKD